MSYWGVIKGPLETPKMLRNKSFMERNFTSGSRLSTLRLKPMPHLTTRFDAGRVIHSTTTFKARREKKNDFIISLLKKRVHKLKTTKIQKQTQLIKSLYSELHTSATFTLK